MSGEFNLSHTRRTPAQEWQTDRQTNTMTAVTLVSMRAKRSSVMVIALLHVLHMYSATLFYSQLRANPSYGHPLVPFGPDMEGSTVPGSLGNFGSIYILQYCTHPYYYTLDRMIVWKHTCMWMCYILPQTWPVTCLDLQFCIIPYQEHKFKRRKGRVERHHILCVITVQKIVIGRGKVCGCATNRVQCMRARVLYRAR